MPSKRRLNVYTDIENVLARKNSNILWKADTGALLDRLPERPLFDLVVTSPPYNVGKEYERKLTLEEYVNWQTEIIGKIVKRLKPTGSMCWIVGNQAVNSHIVPIDIELHPSFLQFGMKLRNRIVWKYGHGLHCSRRFSGRYDVVMWYTLTDNYKFDLDSVRAPSKYPAKRYYKGPNRGKVSSNPKGKNPEDVWEIPQVKAAHIEKTKHPCQFPVGLVERLVLALTERKDVVFDPFAGSGSSGVAATIHDRIFWGSELKMEYIRIAEQRINEAIRGEAKYRPHDRPLYDHNQSPLSRTPQAKVTSNEK